MVSINKFVFFFIKFAAANKEFSYMISISLVDRPYDAVVLLSYYHCTPEPLWEVESIVTQLSHQLSHQYY